jgi:hypothetical protein
LFTNYVTPVAVALYPFCLICVSRNQSGRWQQQQKKVLYCQPDGRKKKGSNKDSILAMLISRIIGISGRRRAEERLQLQACSTLPDALRVPSIVVVEESRRHWLACG